MEIFHLSMTYVSTFMFADALVASDDGVAYVRSTSRLLGQGLLNSPKSSKPPLHTQTQSLPIENFLATVLRLNSIFKRPWVGALFPLISLVVTSCMWRRLSLVRVIKRSLHQRESNPVFCSIWSFRDFRQTHHQNVLGMGFMTCIIQYIYTPVVTLTSTYTF